MSKPRSSGPLNVRGSSVRGKLQLQPNRLVEETIRITDRQKQRVQSYRLQHDGKKLSDAWRDVINAGLEKLGIPYMTIAAAGSVDDAVSATLAKAA